MTSFELCIVHAGPLPTSIWGRLRAYLPIGTSLRLLDLETLTPYWDAGRTGEAGELTVATLVQRLRPELDPRERRVLLGWGFAGLVAHALAGHADHVVALDTVAPHAQPAELTDDDLLRDFAAYVGARRGRTLYLADAVPPVERVLARLLEDSGASDSSLVGLRRLYVTYARQRRRDRALAAAHVAPDRPLTLVRAALGPAGMLGWEDAEDVELLVSSGDHYTMLTDPAAVAHLAALLRRWLAPVPLAA
jgi:thioesterase domain-containing protein